MVRRSSKRERELSPSSRSSASSPSLPPTPADAETRCGNPITQKEPPAAFNKPNDGAFFFVQINGRAARVMHEAPYINLRNLLGCAGVLLQDVTNPNFPVLLLPSPHTGDITVHPRHRYRLMKFVGEHLCMAGDFTADNENFPNRDNAMDTMTTRRREGWAMSELLGVVMFLEQNPEKTAEDFIALPPEEAAQYCTRGRRRILRDNEQEESSEAEAEAEEDDVAEKMRWVEELIRQRRRVRLE